MKRLLLAFLVSTGTASHVFAQSTNPADYHCVELCNLPIDGCGFVYSEDIPDGLPDAERTRTLTATVTYYFWSWSNQNEMWTLNTTFIGTYEADIVLPSVPGCGGWVGTWDLVSGNGYSSLANLCGISNTIIPPERCPDNSSYNFTEEVRCTSSVVQMYHVPDVGMTCGEELILAEVSVANTVFGDCDNCGDNAADDPDTDNDGTPDSQDDDDDGDGIPDINDPDHPDYEGPGGLDTDNDGIADIYDDDDDGDGIPDDQDDDDDGDGIPDVDDPDHEDYQPSTGACCLPDGCIQTTDASCAESNGVWFQDQGCEVCDNVTVLGACCYNSSCASLATEDECQATNGTFYANEPCDACGFELDDVPGICCFEDTSCTTLTRSQCIAALGTWFGPGTDCRSCDLYDAEDPFAEEDVSGTLTSYLDTWGLPDSIPLNEDVYIPVRIGMPNGSQFSYDIPLLHGSAFGVDIGFIRTAVRAVLTLLLTFKFVAWIFGTIKDIV